VSTKKGFVIRIIKVILLLGRKQSKLVDLSSSNYGYDGKRFHGAFTGGFNAGFYNTVGSIEGWFAKYLIEETICNI